MFGYLYYSTFFELSVIKFNTTSYKKLGNIATIIMEDNKDVRNKLSKMKPIILDYLPLTLEEIFIYKMEVLGYEFNEVL